MTTDRQKPNLSEHRVSSRVTRHLALFYRSFISPLRFFAWAVGDALHTVVDALVLAIAGDANRMKRRVSGTLRRSPAFAKGGRVSSSKTKDF